MHVLCNRMGVLATTHVTRFDTRIHPYEYPIPVITSHNPQVDAAFLIIISTQCAARRSSTCCY